ncbi:hypothetical protein BPT24_087 [Tenacibaculum phage pT24]|uniref:Uncharacterized protein n=1 Tax=Tenacibaculum phage pT24 TaxID=1880590 RepID=A0A1B4XWM7_9CAUD|nr:hypothetical protein HYP10_gp087 [Tenacibaculum phage pT24]BAV39212.1 hypothetical protein BPT24_087 [Tenacibaculum phage pT24]
MKNFKKYNDMDEFLTRRLIKSINEKSFGKSELFIKWARLLRVIKIQQKIVRNQGKLKYFSHQRDFNIENKLYLKKLQRTLSLFLNGKSTIGDNCIISNDDLYLLERKARSIKVISEFGFAFKDFFSSKRLADNKTSFDVCKFVQSKLVLIKIDFHTELRPVQVTFDDKKIVAEYTFGSGEIIKVVNIEYDNKLLKISNIKFTDKNKIYINGKYTTK